MAADIPVVQPAEEAVPAQGSKKGLFVAIVAVIVLAGAGAGAWWWLTGSGEGATEEAPPPAGPPLYLALDPPFVVNFEAERLVRFLQVTVQVMSRDPATIDLLRTHDPVVRNDLLLLLGNQKYTEISTLKGKESLRIQALDVVREVVASAGGQPERVEAIYFTSFVMQ